LQERHFQEVPDDGEQQILNGPKLTSSFSFEVQDERDINSLEAGLSCLANYGAEVEPSIITHGRGAYIYTRSGEQILDWTSGQVRNHNYWSTALAVPGHVDR